MTSAPQPAAPAPLPPLKRAPVSPTISLVEPVCDEAAPPRVFHSEEVSPKEFSVDGYLARSLRLDNDLADEIHCVTVLWPEAEVNSAGEACHAAEHIDAAWFRAMKNTFARVPWQHQRVLDRVVIDNRPKEHGIAAHDRNNSNDERDGHTIWVHEDVFREPNHWARGNYGTYWSYHVSVDDRVIDGADPRHTLYSPVLLHELGHLVMYNVVNAELIGPEATDCPECARTCVERGGCEGLAGRARERGCVSPYCAPFRFRSNVENWAEQYRFFYQGSGTRALLGKAGAGCVAQLEGLEGDIGPPWSRNLPDAAPHRPSRWNSCGGRACKAW